MACTFQATIGWQFAPLIGLRDDDVAIDNMISTYNTVITDASSEVYVFGKKMSGGKRLEPPDMLSTSVVRGVLKKRRHETERAKHKGSL